MKIVRGRLNSLSSIFKYYLDDNIMITLREEKISIFSDGSIKRTIKKSRKKNK